MNADHSITLTRLILAAPEAVWRCWTDPSILPNWFGPEGYSCRTKSIALHQGGYWEFDMIGPDGKIWPNRHDYDLYDAPRRIEFRMSDPAAERHHATVMVTLVPEANGTRVTQVMTFPTAEERDAVVQFGAIELGQTTLAKLGVYAAKL